MIEPYGRLSSCALSSAGMGALAITELWQPRSRQKGRQRQAKIVGNVTAPTVGARKKSEVQPHALAYAPGVEMPRHVEAERETLPLAGGAGL